MDMHEKPRFPISTRPKIIGLGGVAGSGKDAVADILESRGWGRTFFSKPVHQAMLTMDPYVGKSDGVRYSAVVRAYGYEGAKKFEEVRRLLQVFATEVVRDMFGADTWSNLSRQELETGLEQGYRMVITGVRFTNELAMLRELGAQLWWVHRPGFGPVNAHSSENTLSYTDFDYVVMNDGTLDDLPNMVTKILGER